jgi:hypothetical protein
MPDSAGIGLGVGKHLRVDSDSRLGLTVGRGRRGLLNGERPFAARGSAPCCPSRRGIAAVPAAAARFQMGSRTLLIAPATRRIGASAVYWRGFRQISSMMPLT